MIALKSKLRVLVIEDELLVAMLIEDMLDSLGHEVAGTAASVGEVRKLLESRDARFDVAVVDLNLHGESSGEIVEELRARGTRIVYSTGRGSWVDRPQADEPVLIKPYREEDLACALVRVTSATG